MIYVLIALVCFIATLTGSICGMGGGIIIKPVLDSLKIMDASTISFLSGCTVLAMSTYSVAEARISKKSEIDPKTGTVLAIGAAVGGIVGKQLFNMVKAGLADASRVGFIQAVCMLILTALCLIYSFVKGRIRPLKITNPVISAVIGLLLGLMSAFLGIGGGPVNVTVLYLLFSMKPKEAAQNSLYIILFCQLFSLIWSLITHTVPAFYPSMLLLMAAAGIIGSITGRLINRKIENGTVSVLFRVLMIVIILINIYNIVQPFIR